MSIALEKLEPVKAMSKALYTYLWARLFVALGLAVSFLYFVFNPPAWIGKVINLYFIFGLYALGALILMRMENRERFLILHFLADALVVSYLYSLYPLLEVSFSLFYLFPLFMAGAVLPPFQLGIVWSAIGALFLGFSYFSNQSPSFILLHIFAFFMAGLASLVLRRDVLLAEKDKREATRWRELYSTVADFLPAGLLLVDGEGIIRAANPKAREILGSDGEGKGIHEVFPSLKAGGQERVERREMRLKGPSGRIIPVGYTLVPLAEGLKVMIFTDLTKIKRLEEEKRRSQVMATLGRMTADLAHDLRNPLGAIGAAADILREMDFPDKDYGELLDIILEESERLDNLAGDFLLFASPGAGARRKEEIDLVALLGALVKKPPFMGKVKLECLHNPLVVMGNKVHLGRVFRNILNNALEADDKKLGVEVRMDKMEGAAWVDVKDYGMGIPQEIMGEIFNPFFTTKHQGVGLGLAICQRIVEEHGGRIYIESELGKGTTVSVMLPFKEA
jgi:signal transduction histidine kinase